MTTIQELIDYVESWRAENGIPEGIDLTSDQLTKLAKDVELKIGELSFKAPVEGVNIIPYNGYVGDTPAWQIAKSTSESSGGNLCYISDIEAGKLLNSTEFKEALTIATGNKMFADNLINGTWENGVRSPFGAGYVLAINDFISKEVMDINAHGNVITFTPKSTPDSVWTLTELPTLLEKPEVTSINGIPKEDLLSKKDAWTSDFFDQLQDQKQAEAKGLQAIGELIKIQSTFTGTLFVFLSPNIPHTPPDKSPLK